MHKLYDRIKEKSYTVGSGSMTLVGATPGFSTFSSVYSSGDTFFYCITNNVDYEIGIGSYGLNSLSKQKIIKSNRPENAAVVWGTGLKEVYVTYPASNSVYSNSGLNNQLAPKNNSLSYWIDANSIGDIEESSWESGILSLSGIFSPNQIVVKDNIAFTGFAQNQVEPFIRNELASGTNANDLLILSGQANQSIGLKGQLTNHVLAGPVNFASGYPTFRPLVDADIPEINAIKVNYTPEELSNWPDMPTNAQEGFDYLSDLLINKEDTFVKNTAFNKNFGSVSGTVTEGNDPRLSDSRTPLFHTHPFSGITENIAINQFNSGVSASSSTYWRGDGTWSVVSGVTQWGSISGNVLNQTDLSGILSTKVNTDDSRLSDSRTPLFHTHPFSGITGNIAISQFNSGIAANSTSYWRGDGTWSFLSTSGITYIDWGMIGGTLSGQVDLQNALNTKANTGHTHQIVDVSGLQTALNNKENSFSKNTAFNKNFGTTAGTVVEGNDSRLAALSGINQFKTNNVQSISTTKTLNTNSEYYQYLTPTAPTVAVRLPLVPTGQLFECEITNDSSVNTLIIQENNGTNILGLDPTSCNRIIRAYWDSQRWRILKMGYYST